MQYSTAYSPRAICHITCRYRSIKTSSLSAASLSVHYIIGFPAKRFSTTYSPNIILLGRNDINRQDKHNITLSEKKSFLSAKAKVIVFSTMMVIDLYIRYRVTTLSEGEFFVCLPKQQLLLILYDLYGIYIHELYLPEVMVYVLHEWCNSFLFIKCFGAVSLKKDGLNYWTEN